MGWKESTCSIINTKTEVDHLTFLAESNIID